MGFVFEKINEEGKKYLKNFVSDSPVYYWAIDREREIILLSLGGWGFDKEQPEFFVFLYKKNIGKILAYRKKEWKTRTEVNVTWYLYEIRFTIALQGKEEELIELVKEAFFTFGSGTQKIKANSTTLAEVANPIFVNDRRG